MTPFDYYMQQSRNSSTGDSYEQQRPSTSTSDDDDDVTMTRNASVRFYVGEREPAQREEFEDEGLDFDDFEFDEASLFEYEYQSGRKSAAAKISPAESGLELDEDTNFSFSSFHFDGIDDDGDDLAPARQHFSYNDDDVIKPRDSSLPIQINFGDHYHHHHRLANKFAAASAHNASSPMTGAPTRQRQRNCVAAVVPAGSCCAEHKTPEGTNIYDEMKRMSRDSVLDTTKIFGELPTKQTRRLSSHYNPITMS